MDIVPRADVDRYRPSRRGPYLSVEALINVDRANGVLYVGRPVRAEPNGTVMLFKLEPTDKFATHKMGVGRAS